MDDMLWCMRTTLNPDDQLLRRAKQLAARSRRTLTAVLEDALRQALGPTGDESRGKPMKLPVSGRPPGVLPRVHLHHSAELLELMERGDASA